MSRLVVAFDLDDVLADFIGMFMGFAHEMYGVDQNLRPTSWEWDDINMNAERVAMVWERIHQTYNFWEMLGVQPGVDQKLIGSLDNQVKLYFPTARAYCKGHEVGYQSAKWIRSKFGVEFPTVIVSNEKGPMATALKYDYFIDDRPKNILEVKAALPDCKVYLCEATHNQKFDNVAAGIPRVADANEFARIVMGAKRQEEK